MRTTGKARLIPRLRSSVEGYLFIAPAFAVIFLFGIFPVAFIVYVSLYQWRIRQGRFLGAGNYTEIFGSLENLAILVLAVAALFVAGFLLGRGRERPARTARAAGFGLLGLALVAMVFILASIWQTGDRDMLASIQVTLWYSIGTVPVQLALGLLLAVLLNRKFRGRQAFRALSILPYIVPTVASAAVFERLFSLRPESFANLTLGLFGAHPLQWLREPKGILQLIFGFSAPAGPGAIGAYWGSWTTGPSLALVSIMFYNYWVFVGYYALIFSNGLAGIPKQLYEAAALDGAGRATTFFRITVPLLSPTTYFLSLLGVIGTFKSFNSIYILRNAGNGGTTDPVSVYIFFTFFRNSRFGYAAALSLVLLAIVVTLTLVQRRAMERHVFYG
jgi:multiple sugar transport system permease protein